MVILTLSKSKQKDNFKSGQKSPGKIRPFNLDDADFTGDDLRRPNHRRKSSSKYDIFAFNAMINCSDEGGFKYENVKKIESDYKPPVNDEIDLKSLAKLNSVHLTDEERELKK